MTPALRQGLTPCPASPLCPFTSRASARLPHPRHDPRQAPGLPRQRRHQPEAPGRDRRGHPVLRDRERQHPPRRALPERASHRGVRGDARNVARFINARQPGDHLHPRHHRGINLVAQSYGPRTEPRRRDRHDSDGAPFEHRALAARLRADRRPSARSRSTTPASWTSTRSTAARPIAPGSSPWFTSPTRSAPSIPSGAGRPGARARDPGAGRRRPGGPASPGRRPGARTATSSPSPGTSSSAHRHRRALRSGGAARRMPPYQGGGDMIATCHPRAVDLGPLPAKFEAGTPMIAEVVGSAPRSTT